FECAVHVCVPLVNLGVVRVVADDLDRDKRTHLHDGAPVHGATWLWTAPRRRRSKRRWCFASRPTRNRLPDSGARRLAGAAPQSTNRNSASSTAQSTPTRSGRLR